MFCPFVFLQQQHAPTRLTEDLRGHVRGRAAYSEDRFGHNHRKTKVSQLQPTDVSSFTLYLRWNKEKAQGTDRNRDMEGGRPEAVRPPRAATCGLVGRGAEQRARASRHLVLPALIFG